MGGASTEDIIAFAKINFLKCYYIFNWLNCSKFGETMVILLLKGLNAIINSNVLYEKDTLEDIKPLDS